VAATRDINFFLNNGSGLCQLLHLRILLRDYFCLSLPSTHEYVNETLIRPRRLADQSFIAPEQEAGTYEIARQGRFTPRIVSRPGTLLAVLTQVSLGAGIAVMPSVVRNVVRVPGVVFRRISREPILSEVAAVFRSDEDSPTVKNLIRQIQVMPERRLDPADWLN
jgi:DNA-binding transcriptional LysR family regulator